MKSHQNNRKRVCKKLVNELTIVERSLTIIFIKSNTLLSILKFNMLLIIIILALIYGAFIESCDCFLYKN